MDLIQLSNEITLNQMKNQEYDEFDSIIDSMLLMISNVIGFSKKAMTEECCFANTSLFLLTEEVMIMTLEN